jgi:hypothetical protein
VDFDTFKVGAIAVHGNRYEYVPFTGDQSGNKFKVDIVCRAHGLFKQSISKHIGKEKTKCPECAKIERGAKRRENRAATLLNDFIKIHGDKYDYSLVKYVKSDKYLDIICKRHGVFKQTSETHLGGCGCPKCANELTANKKLKGLPYFLKKAKEIHRERYDYSLANFTTLETPIKIICREHGEFFQSPEKHLLGRGCQKCGARHAASQRKDTTESFTAKACKIHEDRYNYSEVDFLYSDEKVKIICKEHGAFWQTPNSHLGGQGCNKCSHHVSKPEIELCKFISGLGLKLETSVRGLIGKKEIDILVPEKNLAIEINGIFWHSEAFGGKERGYHLDKTNAAQSKGLRMVHVFEDELLYKRDIVKSRIKNMLVKMPTIFARRCSVREVDPKIKNKFLNKYHIQEGDKSSVSLGLFLGWKMVAVMTFCKSRIALGNKTEGLIELSRFATISNFRIVGGAGKLLAFYEDKYKPKAMITYADKRWSEGNLYKKLGFEKSHDSPPNYWYFSTTKNLLTTYKTRTRYHRYNFTKFKLKKKLGDKFDPSKTEWEIMRENGFDRIWDCGNIVFKKTYKNK